jgi:two-component system response regulator AtoC
MRKTGLKAAPVSSSRFRMYHREEGRNADMPIPGEAQIRILLIEDEAFDVRRVKSTVKFFKDQIQIKEVISNGDAALELLGRKRDQFDVVIMDLQIAGGTMGEALIRAIKRIIPSMQIIVITKKTVNVTDFDFANRLLRAGAFWYCTKYPSDIEEYIYQPTDFIISIFNAYEKRQLEREQRRSERKLLRNVEEALQRSRLLGISEQMQKLRAQIKQCATTNATVLITGQSGTGKELVAANIHYESHRKLESFVAINCGGIPDDLIESELFGYERGAFTGAQTSKQGLFEVANHGTVFLDEIAELPLAAQVKLLRVIQEGELEKIGRIEKLNVDVRIVAASNKVLFQEVAAGRFREDLYYRLNVVPLTAPALKDRPADVPVLWEHFMLEMSADMGVEKPTTDEEAFKILADYPWPGNVRELKNVVQRLLLRRENIIGIDTIADVLALSFGGGALTPGTSMAFPAADKLLPLRDLERELRKKYVIYVRNHSISDAEAAKKLGLAPPNYHRMCKDLGLKD